MRISDWSSDVCSSDLPGRYLPYARHVTPDVIALDSGDLMMMFRLEGLAFETADPIHLNDWHEKLNGTWRNIADDRLAIWTHIVRSAVGDYPEGQFRSKFAAAPAGKYRKSEGSRAGQECVSTCRA